MILFFFLFDGSRWTFFLFFFLQKPRPEIGQSLFVFFFLVSVFGDSSSKPSCVFFILRFYVLCREEVAMVKKKIGESGNHLRIFFPEGKKPSLGNWRKKKECRWRNESVGMKKSFEISTTKNKFVPKNGTRTTIKRRANEATKPPDCISQFQLS